MIYQQELCSTTSRKHYQGYLEFLSKLSLFTIKNILGDQTAHIEKRWGTAKQAAEYCKKSQSSIQNTLIELGQISHQGQRNDLNQLATEIIEGKDPSTLLQDYPTQFIRYGKSIKAFSQAISDEKANLALQEEYKGFIPNPFQLRILDALDQQTKRQILYVYDPIGNTGKTYLSRYLVAYKYAFRCSGGKNADIAYAYNGEPYFIMDLSRSMESYTNYDIVEQIKNGMIFSQKYESCQKIFPIPRVLLLANFPPDTSKLSADRWQVISP